MVKFSGNSSVVTQSYNNPYVYVINHYYGRPLRWGADYKLSLGLEETPMTN